MEKRTCSVDGCESPSRKRTWCASHYAQWYKKGTVAPFSYKWVGEGGSCVVCDDDVPTGSRTRYCSAGCKAASSRNRGRPTSAVCDFCGQDFSLGRSAGGRLQRADTKWCPDCGRTSPEVQRFRRYGVTREQFDKAMVAGCEICGRITDKPLHVDHDHSCCPTGGGSSLTCGQCVRGFLCGPCNRGIGLFFDSADAVQNAADYLRATRQDGLPVGQREVVTVPCAHVESVGVHDDCPQVLDC